MLGPHNQKAYIEYTYQQRMQMCYGMPEEESYFYPDASRGKMTKDVATHFQGHACSFLCSLENHWAEEMVSIEGKSSAGWSGIILKRPNG